MAFSDEAVRAIIETLPANVTPERRKLLPQLLRDWVDHELPYRLYRENPANVRERQSRLQAVASRAEDLCEALAALDRQAALWLAMQSAIHETGKSFVRLNQSDVTQARERLQSVEEWARELAEASRDLSESQTKRRGRPRAITSSPEHAPRDECAARITTSTARNMDPSGISCSRSGA
jgi:hypothetical protein